MTDSASSSAAGGAGTSGSVCRTADLSITLGKPGAAAGSTYYPLVFTNTGSTACTLHGFPGVSYVAGDDGHQVGAPAAWVGDKGRAVTVEPGKTATAQLQEPNVHNFPDDVCDPTPVRGLRVYAPGDTRAAFVPQDGAVGCAAKSLPDGQFQLAVKAITAR